MQSPWGTASHDGGMNQQPPAPAWPDHFDFTDPDSHFDVAQWADPVPGDASYPNFDAQGVAGHQTLFQPQEPQHQQPQQHPQHQQHQQHLQQHPVSQPSYSSGHQPAVGTHNVSTPGGFDGYDGSKFSFGQGPGHHQDPQGFVSQSMDEFARHDGQGFGHVMPQQYPPPPQPQQQPLSVGPQTYGRDAAVSGQVARQQPHQQQQAVTRSHQPSLLPSLRTSQGSPQTVPSISRAESQPYHGMPLAHANSDARTGTPLSHAHVIQNSQQSRISTPNQQIQNAQGNQHQQLVPQPVQRMLPSLQSAGQSAGQSAANPQPHTQYHPQSFPQTSQAPPSHATPVPYGSSPAVSGFQPPLPNQIPVSAPQGSHLAPSAQTKTASPRPSVEALGEPATKRRKKTTPAAVKKAAADASVESTPERSASPTTLGISQKTLDDVDALAAPEPTPSDRDMIAQSEKRKGARFAAVNGLPYLVATKTVKLSAPKNHDKLLPVVAHPSRSGKAMVPELGGDLPCEVQGRFSAAYHPDLAAPGGLDFRRSETASHLQKFEQDMLKLGRRRPRYTEYPQSFKDQIKADEAAKTKAERKAKKEKEVPVIRSDVRPDDPIEAAGWDILGAVCLDDGATRSSKIVGEAVVQVRDILTALRSKLTQAKQDVDQAVKDGEDAKEVAMLRKNYEARQEALYKALDVCIEHGEDAVLENLGGHPRLVLTLVNILISCINSGDVNGKIAKATLELMTHFSMTKQVAQQANFNSVQKRLADKGDIETKDLLKDVVAGIKDTNDSKDATPASPTSKTVKSMAKSIATTLSTKRSRDDDGEPRTVKKIAVESGNSLSRKMGPQKFLLSSASKAAPSTKSGASSAVTTYSSKARAISKPAPKIDPPAGSELVRVVARPDPSRMAMARLEAAKSQSSSRITSGSSSASASSGGIASLLDMINAPKPERALQRVPKAIAEAPENPGDRTKRLRKEARRRLRVTWRPDNELEQIRIFHQDAHENEGRSANMTRDVADGRREGMLLKQRKNQSLDEDDEDDDSDGEIASRPWETPVLTAMAGVPDKARAKNYATRGGDVGVETDEQRSMAEREQRELMAIYTDPADIPPTPKSPAPEPAPFVDAKVVPLPASFTEIHNRWETATKFGQQSALYYATQRLDAAKSAAKPSSSAGVINASQATARPPKTHNTPIILPAGSMHEQVLFLLTHNRVKNWADDAAGDRQAPADAGPVGGFAAELAALAKILSGKPFPPTQPPDWLADVEKVREWWTGYHQDLQRQAQGPAEEVMRAPAGTLFPPPPQQAQQSGWGAFFPPPPPPHGTYQQQQHLAPYMAMLQPGQGYTPGDSVPPFPPPPPPQAGNPDLQAIFAQLGQAGGAPPHPSALPQIPIPPQYMHLNPNDPSFAQIAMLQQQLAQQQQQQQQQSNTQAEARNAGDSGSGMDWEPDRRDRDRDRAWDRDWDPSKDASWNDQKRGGTTKKVTLPPHRPVNAALIGTKPCTFWRQGKCARGDSCTFRHD